MAATALEDVATVDDALREMTLTDLGGIDPCVFISRVIDFLDKIRKRFTGHNPLSGDWWVKQGLDTVITLLHAWQQKNCTATPNRR